MAAEIHCSAPSFDVVIKNCFIRMVLLHKIFRGTHHHFGDLAQAFLKDFTHCSGDF